MALTKRAIVLFALAILGSEAARRDEQLNNALLEVNDFGDVADELRFAAAQVDPLVAKSLPAVPVVPSAPAVASIESADAIAGAKEAAWQAKHNADIVAAQTKLEEKRAKLEAARVKLNLDSNVLTTALSTLDTARNTLKAAKANTVRLAKVAQEAEDSLAATKKKDQNQKKLQTDGKAKLLKAKAAVEKGAKDFTAREKELAVARDAVRAGELSLEKLKQQRILEADRARKDIEADINRQALRREEEGLRRINELRTLIQSETNEMLRREERHVQHESRQLSVRTVAMEAELDNLKKWLDRSLGRDRTNRDMGVQREENKVVENLGKIERKKEAIAAIDIDILAQQPKADELRGKLNAVEAALVEAENKAAQNKEQEAQALRDRQIQTEKTRKDAEIAKKKAEEDAKKAEEEKKLLEAERQKLLEAERLAKVAALSASAAGSAVGMGSNLAGGALNMGANVAGGAMNMAGNVAGGAVSMGQTGFNTAGNVAGTVAGNVAGTVAGSALNAGQVGLNVAGAGLNAATNLGGSAVKLASTVPRPSIPSVSVPSPSLPTFRFQEEPLSLLQVEEKASALPRLSNIASAASIPSVGSNINLGSNVNLGGNLGGNIGTNLGGNIGTNLGGNIGTNLGGNIGTNLGGNIGTNLGGNIGTNLGGNIGGNLGGNIGGGVPGGITAPSTISGLPGGGISVPKVFEDELTDVKDKKDDVDVAQVAVIGTIDKGNGLTPTGAVDPAWFNKKRAEISQAEAKVKARVERLRSAGRRKLTQVFDAERAVTESKSNIFRLKSDFDVNSRNVIKDYMQKRDVIMRRFQENRDQMHSAFSQDEIKLRAEFTPRVNKLFKEMTGVREVVKSDVEKIKAQLTPRIKASDAKFEELAVTDAKPLAILKSKVAPAENAVKDAEATNAKLSKSSRQAEVELSNANFNDFGPQVAAREAEVKTAKDALKTAEDAEKQAEKDAKEAERAQDKAKKLVADDENDVKRLEAEARRLEEDVKSVRDERMPDFAQQASNMLPSVPQVVSIGAPLRGQRV